MTPRIRPVPLDIWDQAVAEVDGEHGYTVEFAPDPNAHRAEYAERAEQIATHQAKGEAMTENTQRAIAEPLSAYVKRTGLSEMGKNEVAQRIAELERLCAALAHREMSGRCEMAETDGDRCRGRTVAARWETGFVDFVCSKHAATARDRGALVIAVRAADGSSE